MGWLRIWISYFFSKKVFIDGLIECAMAVLKIGHSTI
jgi:hypothetical protein